MTEAVIIEDIQGNRERYIEALRSATGQCRGALFSKIDGEEKRCAVGVAATVFLGIRNKADLVRWVNDNPDTHIYEAIADKLGIPDQAEDEHAFDIDTLWKMNDRDRMSFEGIASDLTTVWELA